MLESQKKEVKMEKKIDDKPITVNREFCIRMLKKTDLKVSKEMLMPFGDKVNAYAQKLAEKASANSKLAGRKVMQASDLEEAA